MMQSMLSGRNVLWVATTMSMVVLAGCGGSSGHSNDNAAAEKQRALVAEGQQVFRYDTFGNETFWTDALRMNEVIEDAVDPLTAAGVGLKVDIEKLLPAVVAGVADGSIPLDDPQTTLALLSLDAVVGIKGEVSKDESGTLHLDRVGITCALCHSTVSHEESTFIKAGFDPALAKALNGVIGVRLDGWPNRELQPGTIISLSPALAGDPRQVEYASWAAAFGAGFYDARINVNVDPGSNPALAGTDIADNLAAYKAAGGNPVVIPPAYGLKGVNRAIFTGDGDSAHEPVGPVAYWNRYVAVTQMQGHGTFHDERLIINGQALNVDHTDAGAREDRVTPILPALQAYQLSIAAPDIGDYPVEAAARGVTVNEEAAARGQVIFNGAGNCVQCHSGSALTDANEALHDTTAASNDDFLAFSATKQWRATPLKGLWTHAPYFHDGSAETLKDVVLAYNTKNTLGLTENQMNDLAEYLKTL